MHFYVFTEIFYMKRRVHLTNSEKAFFFADDSQRELISRLDLKLLVGGVATKDDLDVIHSFRADPYFRFYYVLDGQVSLAFADQNYQLQPGRVYIIPTNRPFRYVAPSNFTHYWLHFCSSQLEKLDYFQHVREELAVEDTCTLMQEFIRLAECGEGVDVLMNADIILRRLLLPFMRKMPENDYEQARKIGKYSHIIDYINRNIARDIAVTDLAAMLRMNYRDFSADFHRTFRITPKQYICNRRIDTAKALLLNTDMTIKQISSETGYDNEFFFYRLFKKYTGQTPTYFRHNNILG